MSDRAYTVREGGRHHTDPTGTRFHLNSNLRYNRRGRGNTRPIPTRRPNSGDDLDRITVSIGRNFTTDGVSSQGSTTRSRFVNRHAPRQIHLSNHMNDRDNNQTRWWRVSIQNAGTIGKERVMSTLKAHCVRQFQPYHVNLIKTIFRNFYIYM